VDCYTRGDPVRVFELKSALDDPERDRARRAFAEDMP